MKILKIVREKKTEYYDIIDTALTDISHTTIIYADNKYKVSFVPCIIAVVNEYKVKEWRPDSDIDSSEIQEWADKNESEVDLSEFVQDDLNAESKILTHYQFRQRFTFEEKIAIETSTDSGVMVIREDFKAAQEIDLTFQPTIDGMGYLVAQGLLTESRKEEILSFYS